MSHRWYPDDGSHTAWLLTLAAGLLALTGPIGLVRWWRGYGAQGRRLRVEEPRRFAVMARVGCAGVPLTLGLFSLAGGLAFLNLKANTGQAFFGNLGEIAFLLFLAFGVWAVKEIVCPSRWMPRPDWVVAYARRHGNRF